jgi:glycosyltransferase involved in cell wall biosynthesis
MELEQEGIRRIFTAHRWRCLSPDAFHCWNRGLGYVMGGVCRRIARHLGIDKGIGWIPKAEQACASLTANEVDVILASGPPFASFALAKRLSDKLGRPYVLDYRDPWTIRHHEDPITRPSILKWEAALINSSSAVTTISQSLLNSRPGPADKFHVVTNGYDPEEMARVKAHDFGHRAIIYAGSFSPPKRVISPVMAALRCLKNTDASRGVEWRFHYYGAQGDYVQAEAKRFDVLEKVVVHGKVKRAEALAAIAGSVASVVVTSVLSETAAEDQGIVTGKLFDSLGLGIPVLVIGHNGSDVEQVVQDCPLARLVPGTDIDGIVSFMQEAISSSASRVQCPEAYAWPTIIEKLDLILRNSIAARLGINLSVDCPLYCG